MDSTVVHKTPSQLDFASTVHLCYGLDNKRLKDLAFAGFGRQLRILTLTNFANSLLITGLNASCNVSFPSLSSKNSIGAVHTVICQDLQVIDRRCLEHDGLFNQP
jgi:hypothetical protein